MSKELINKIEKVFKDSTYCGWGEVLEELKQALEDKQSKLNKINHYNRTELCYGIVYDKIKQILGEPK